jgi:16S rRNA processing protein RimM
VEPEFLVVGQITKPHGTKGEVFVWPLTEHPEEVFAEGQELIQGDTEGAVDEAAPALKVEQVREFKRGLLVKWEGYADRTAVTPLGGRYLLVPAGQLTPLKEGEVYYHQLLGLEVVTAEGEVVGRIREVYETEPAHLLEVKGPERLHLIPFVKRIVKKVDLEAGRVVIKPPPGLLDI